MVTAPGVESYMAVGADASKEEPYASKLSYLLFIVGAPIVDFEY